MHLCVRGLLSLAPVLVYAFRGEMRADQAGRCYVPQLHTDSVGVLKNGSVPLIVWFSLGLPEKLPYVSLGQNCEYVPFGTECSPTRSSRKTFQKVPLCFARIKGKQVMPTSDYFEVPS